DHLQPVVIQKDAVGWINEYKKVARIMSIIDAGINEGFDFEMDKVKKMPLSNNLKQIMGLYTNSAKTASFINIRHSDGYFIRYIYEDHVQHLVADYPVSKTDCYLILLYLLYYS